MSALVIVIQVYMNFPDPIGQRRHIMMTQISACWRPGALPVGDTLSFWIGGGGWLNGRVLDSGGRGPGFEPHNRCVVSLSQDTFSSPKYWSPRKQWRRPNMTEKLFTGTLNNNQTKPKPFGWSSFIESNMATCMLQTTVYNVHLLKKIVCNVGP